jgi:polyisoprenoid-binding protein YceI
MILSFFGYSRVNDWRERLNRKLVLIGGGALALVAIIGVVIFGVVLRQPEAASGPLSAVPIVVATPRATEQAQATVGSQSGAAAQAQATAGSQSGAAAPSAGADKLIFQIVPDQSEARFQLDEVLRGQPNTVIGKTNQIAGQIAISPNDLSATQLGKIQVNARTLATDEDRRNRAIQNFILNTNSYELISFEPTSITGLSGPAALGQPYNFEIAGNLTIRDVTQPVVFKATAQAESADRLVGNVSTVIKRSDYNLTIPNVPFVANVGEEVTLQLDFVATPVQQ